MCCTISQGLVPSGACASVGFCLSELASDHKKPKLQVSPASAGLTSTPTCVGQRTGGRILPTFCLKALSQNPICAGSQRECIPFQPMWAMLTMFVFAPLLAAMFCKGAKFPVTHRSTGSHWGRGVQPLQLTQVLYNL